MPSKSGAFSEAPHRRDLGKHHERRHVCYWHKADMGNALTNVRFWGQSGH
jgi:hypothetical protein